MNGYLCLCEITLAEAAGESGKMLWLPTERWRASPSEKAGSPLSALVPWRRVQNRIVRSLRGAILTSQNWGEAVWQQQEAQHRSIVSYSVKRTPFTEPFAS